MSAQQRLIGVAECLPQLSLPRADSPARIAWSQGRQASVLVFPHLRPCPACDHYLVDLSKIGDDLREWATRLLVVMPAGEHGAEPPDEPAHTAGTDRQADAPSAHTAGTDRPADAPSAHTPAPGRLADPRSAETAPATDTDEPTDAGPGDRLGYIVLVDADGGARRRVGVSGDDVAVIVADRWGAVYQVTAAGADHFLPDPRDLVGLAKFIDIQCPECEVPSPEWGRACPLPLG
jgi:hypothetical protein